MVAHSCDLSTQKAEAGGFLRGRDSLGYRDPVLKKKSKKEEKEVHGVGD